MRTPMSAAVLVMMVSSVAGAGEKPGIAVMEFTSKGGVTAQQMDSLADLLANQIRETGRFRVVGKSDIRALLNFQEQKQLLACTDEACVSEIGGALGVRWIVVGNVSKFGTSYLLNLKLVEVKAASVRKGISRKVSGGQEALIDALQQAAVDLVAAVAADVPVQPVTPPPDALAQKPAGGGGTEVRAAAPGRGDTLNLLGHIATWSGTALLVLGGVSTYLAWDAGQDWKDESLESAARLDARERSRAWTVVMWAGYGAGAALLAGGVLLWLLAPKEPAAATVAPMAGVSAGGGMVLGVGGRF